MVQGVGFEPTKGEARSIYSRVPLTTQPPLRDLTTLIQLHPLKSGAHAFRAGLSAARQMIVRFVSAAADVPVHCSSAVRSRYLKSGLGS